MGNEIQFTASNKEDTIIVRPSIIKCDIYIRGLDGREQCVTDEITLNEEQATFYAMSYVL